MDVVKELNEFRQEINFKILAVPMVIMLVLWGIGIGHWLRKGDALFMAFLLYIGVFFGVGLGLYLSVPDRRRPMARKLMMLILGTLLLVLALTTDHGNMQIEGLFFGVLMVFAPFVVLHYALAKVVGPLIFGRVWCGWACWYGMVFDMLPYPYSRYRIPGKWGYLRYVHFFGSLIAVLVLWFGFDYRGGATGLTGMHWFIVGLVLYYVVGVAMAFILKDNRAFCKYLCPIAVPMKATSRFALLKVTGTDAKCGECMACMEMCPMNIRVRDYLERGERVMSTECTLCQTCINICPHNALKLSFGLDIGGEELIDYEPPKRKAKAKWFDWLRT